MVTIQYLGQNGFKIRMDDLCLCFDLYLSNCVYELTGKGIRNYDAPISYESLKEIDYYFISHDHLDHLDPETIKNLSVNKNITFICPFPYIGILERLGVENRKIIGARADEKIDFNGFYVIPIPEKHESYTLIDGDHGNLGYVVCADKFRFYHAGDAIADKTLAESLKRFGRYNVMFLPINGHDWKRFDNEIMGNMNYREALDLCDYVGADMVVPMHFDLFCNNTENPAYFVDYLYRNYPYQKFKMFTPGATIHIKADSDNDRFD